MQDDAEKERLVRENIEREQMDKAREEAEAVRWYTVCSHIIETHEGCCEIVL